MYCFRLLCASVLISGVDSEFGTWFGLAMLVNLQCLYINVSLTVFVQRPAFSHVLLLSAHIFKSTRLSLQICLFVFRFTSISSHSLLDLAHRSTEFMASHAVLLLYKKKNLLIYMVMMMMMIVRRCL